MYNSSIEKVFNLALATFNRKCGMGGQGLEALLEATNRVTAECVGLDKSPALQASMSPVNTAGGREAPVTYIPVAENRDVSMGVFIIKEGSSIPLHDHPHMHGILRCLVGKLKITSMTRMESVPKQLPERLRRSPHMVGKLQEGELFLAEQDSSVWLTPESVTCAMVGPKSNNIHRVESVDGPAAFLDILAPPYNIDPYGNPEDKQERDCHYFREVCDGGPGLQQLQQPGGEPARLRKWLLMCEPPPSFYCDTEPYRGPRVANQTDFM